METQRRPFSGSTHNKLSFSSSPLRLCFNKLSPTPRARLFVIKQAKWSHHPKGGVLCLRTQQQDSSTALHQAPDKFLVCQTPTDDAYGYSLLSFSSISKLTGISKKGEFMLSTSVSKQMLIGAIAFKAMHANPGCSRGKSGTHCLSTKLSWARCWLLCSAWGWIWTTCGDHRGRDTRLCCEPTSGEQMGGSRLGGGHGFCAKSPLGKTIPRGGKRASGSRCQPERQPVCHRLRVYTWSHPSSHNSSNNISTDPRPNTLSYHSSPHNSSSYHPLPYHSIPKSSP